MSHEEETDDEVAPWDLLTGALGSLQDIEDDDDTELNVVEGMEEVDEDGLTKVPLEKAGNLIKLRNWTSGVIDGSLSKEDFLNNIRPMHRSLENGMKVIKTDALQEQLAEFTEVERKIFDATYQSIRVLYDGLTQMLLYKESNNPEDVEKGMQMVEDGMLELDHIQDEAIELAQQEPEESEE